VPLQQFCYSVTEIIFIHLFIWYVDNILKFVFNHINNLTDIFYKKNSQNANQFMFVFTESDTRFYIDLICNILSALPVTFYRRTSIAMHYCENSDEFFIRKTIAILWLVTQSRWKNSWRMAISSSRRRGQSLAGDYWSSTQSNLTMSPLRTIATCQ